MKVNWSIVIKIIPLTIMTGWLLRYVVGLEPVWWLAWLAPAALLALAYRAADTPARWLVGGAALIAASVNLPYYQTVMPAGAAFAVTLAQALVWLPAVMGARRVVLRYQRWWTVFAYPVIWTATDTLMAALLPDGNWGNIGYSQHDFLYALQIGALFGTGGVTFMVSLVASALAMALAFGVRGPRVRHACAAAAVLALATLGYGALRLQAAPQGTEMVFGLVAVDDASGLQATAAYSEPIWRQYERHIVDLARQGAGVIVLPEKVAMMSPAQAAQVRERFARLAARLKVWIEIGVGIDNAGAGDADASQGGAKARVNLAWLLSPEGTLAQSYQKRHMAPPERGYLSGDDYSVHTIGGVRYGLAICKDMHFAAVGRAYGRRQTGVMLVPAWDFGADRVIATGMTAMRGVENGYTVVRSAREGLLTVTDPYGRVVARRDSALMPGSAMLVRVKVSAPVPTLYSRIGDAFGWLCVVVALAAATAMLAGGRRVKPGAPVVSP
jgi:apolipoprotein N-acyltransferase